MSVSDELFREAGLDSAAIRELVAATIDEDLNGGSDATSEATVPRDHRSRLTIASRQPGVVAGLPVAMMAFEVVAERIHVPLEIDNYVRDGSRLAAGVDVLTVSGHTRSLLTAERTALNFLGHLSGVATLTDQWVRALGRASTTRVRDTRKTTPLLRSLEKYAVRCGGGFNHRAGLNDAILIKDNHIAACGSLRLALEAARAYHEKLPIEVEVDTWEQLEEAVEAGADFVLLDNFTIEQIERAVVFVPDSVRLEASGGLTLESAAAVGATNVDFVAVGALTHSAPILDFGADYRATEK